MEAKQREIAKARKAHAIAMGQQAALPKGGDAVAPHDAAEEGHWSAGEGPAEGTGMALDASEATFNTPHAEGSRMSECSNL